jgi:hypothetical protein
MIAREIGLQGTATIGSSSRRIQPGMSIGDGSKRKKKTKKPGPLVRSPGKLSWEFQLGSGPMTNARRVSHRRTILWA